MPAYYPPAMSARDAEGYYTYVGRRRVELRAVERDVRATASRRDNEFWEEDFSEP